LGLIIALSLTLSRVQHLILQETISRERGQTVLHLNIHALRLWVKAQAISIPDIILIKSILDARSLVGVVRINGLR
jgi:hypothetical protein